jgi:hypothetical protein
VTKRFKLVARISSSNPETVRPILQRLITKGTIREEGGDFIVEAELEGSDAKELNRSLLSELRRSVKKTTLRGEWTSEDHVTQRFFDYVLKKTSKNQKS